MDTNEKLTSIISGRTISFSSYEDGLLMVKFSDGSQMSIITSDPSNPVWAGGMVEKVRHDRTEIELHIKEGSTIHINTAEETASVALRDKDGNLEYGD